MDVCTHACMGNAKEEGLKDINDDHDGGKKKVIPRVQERVQAEEYREWMIIERR